MKKKLLLLFSLLCMLGTLGAQDTEFWFSASDVATTHGDSPMFFVFTNPGKLVANVTVEYWGGKAPGSAPYTYNFTINPGGYHKWDIGNATHPKGLFETSAQKAGIVSNYGIHITSDQKILVYYMVNHNLQRDIYSLKGAPALGTKFITPFMQHAGEYFEQRPQDIYNMGSDEIEIVATQPNTTVTVDLKKQCMYGTTGHLAAGLHTFTFDYAGQTLTLREDTIGTANTPAAIAATKNAGTLAGTMISSDKPIAVTQTEDCLSPVSFPPRIMWATDLVGDQLVPEDMVGKRYIVLRGHSTVGERVDFVAIKDGTTIDVHYWDGGTQAQVSSPTLNRGDMWHVDMTNITAILPYNAASAKASDIFVNATEPVYCYQHSATRGELGGAIIPSMYSISQQQITFYQSNGAVNENNIFLVFRANCDTAFTVSIDGGADQKFSDAGLTITPTDIPSAVAGEWKYANVTLPNTWNNKVVTIKNEESTFSLGYFNGIGGTAGYGYLSGFGSFEFDPDTFWRCADNPRPITVVGGYALSYKWSYYPDTGYHTPTATWTTPSIRARKKGMYVLEMNQDPRIIKDTVWVLDMVFDTKITRKPNKPAKIGVPQVFTATVGGKTLPNLTYEWTFEGGHPSTASGPVATTTWNITGQRKVTLRLSASGGSGVNRVDCDTTIVMDLMLHEKNIGYFVDQNVNGGKHDGSNWQNAFTTIEEALDKASQGDCIWVAEGNYTPKKGKSYILDYDSVEVYGGFGAWEADLNERDYHAHKTVMNGNGASTVVFDGSNTYTSGSCGVSRAARVDGFVIRGGTAADGAGILFRAGASGTVANSVVKENMATNNGGGVYIEGRYGGCITGSKDPLLYNVEISHNRAAQGAGIYNNGSAFVSVNNTISGNAAPVAAGLHNDGDALLRNTIIWGNITGGTLGNDVTNTGGNPTYTHSNIAGWSNALGKDGGRNIDKNPLFLRKGYDEDNLTLLKDGNYRLAQSSPSVNTGYNGFVLAGLRNRTSTELLKPIKATYADAAGLDLAGYARIYDNTVDMGAYEYHPAGGAIDLDHPVIIGTYPNVTTIPPKGFHYVKGQEDFTITLIPDQGYSLKDLKVTTGSKIRDEKGGVQLTHNADGTVTVVLKKVTEPLNVMLSGIKTVGNISIADGYAIWSKAGILCIQTSKAARLNVYTVTGRLIHRSRLEAGETTVPLAQGLYIVTLDGEKRQKVMIR